MSQTPFRQAIIIGASSGIGLALAQLLTQNGTHVALVARRLDLLEEICRDLNAKSESPSAFAYQHDVNNIAEVPDLFQRITRDLGGVDLVVYASGIMLPVRSKEYDTVKDVETINVNLIGAMAWLNEAAVRFQALYTGTIIGISSVAGDRGRRSSPAYNVSKAAFSTYLEALRNRLSMAGVHVVTIKPGYVSTPMLTGAKIPKFLPVITPEAAAKSILASATSSQQTVYVPAIWGPIMRLVRSIPSPIFRRLNV